MASALHWILLIAVAVCFVGHGAFGIITKAAWVPYFERQIAPGGEVWRLP